MKAGGKYRGVGANRSEGGEQTNSGAAEERLAGVEEEEESRFMCRVGAREQ